MTPSASRSFRQKLRILNICSNSDEPVVDCTTTTITSKKSVSSLNKKDTGFSPARIFQDGLNESLVATRLSPAWSFSISPLFLYDTRGLEIFDKITEVSEYYLTAAERVVLTQYADRIASLIPNNARIVELGAGSMTKTAILLEAITTNFQNRKAKSMDNTAAAADDYIDHDVLLPIYQAVDICTASLAVSLHDLNTLVPDMHMEGLCGSYEDAVKYLQRENAKFVESGTPRRPLVILWLGSSIGNMKREDATDFMNHFRSSVFLPGDLWMTGLDGRNWNPERARKAYNDTLGVTKDFILNGLVNINRILVNSMCNEGDETAGPGIAESYRTSPFPVDKFKYIGIYNEIEGRHEAYLEATEDITLEFQFNQRTFDNFLFQEWNSVSPSLETTFITVSDYCNVDEIQISKEISSCEDTVTDEAIELMGFLAIGSGTACVNKKLMAGDKIHMEYSYKYSPNEIEVLFDRVKLNVLEHLVNPAEPYHFIIGQEMPFWIQNPNKELALDSKTSPTLKEWEELWMAWDFITGLIKPVDLLYQPINLRHPLLFYLGHIPSFLDHHFLINMTPDLERRACLPKRNVPASINIDNFLRGIDPDVDDPSRCHNHSKLPNIWPSLEALNLFKDNIRDRLRTLLNAADSSAPSPMMIPLKFRKALWMAFEHEAMHLETMIYMMNQCPPGMLKELTIQRPFGESVEPHTTNDSCFQYIPGGRVSLGRSHLREGLKEDECNNWGWDNEYPEVQVSVKSFRMLRSNVTVRDYVDFLVSCQTKSGSVPQELVPVSWMQVTQNKETLFFNCDDYAVRSLFGPVSLHEAFSWPVFVNGLQAEKYATQQGCRLPTEAEWILAKTNQEARKIGCVQQQILEARHTGVHKTMSVKHYNKNVGFKSWCPSNISIPLNQVSGKENVFEATENFIYDMVGSGWEWTCTIFGSLTEQIQPGEKIEEVFIEQDGYPEYSSDFFDGKHWVVLGGSWATHPSLSDRRTFRNWYQPGYGYVFAKFRCVQDINLSELPELA